MIQYTPSQIFELFDLVRNNGIYPSYIVNTFMSDDTNFATNKIVICKCSDAVYKNMCYVRKDSSKQTKTAKVRDFIFNVEKDSIPLYINDELLRPILIWRLQSNI